MSKQSEAKVAQGYTTVQHACATCANYTSDVTEREGVFGGTYRDEANKRCGIGGFAVRKFATCNQWAAMAEAHK